MSLETCFERVKKWTEDSGLKDNFSTARLKQFARMLEAAGSDALTPAQFAAKAQALIEEDTARFYAKVKTANAMAMLKTKVAFDTWKENTANWKEDISSTNGFIDKKFYGDKSQMPGEAFRAWLQGGSVRPGLETNLDTSKMAESIAADIRSEAREALAPFYKEAQHGALDSEMWQAKEAIVKKLPMPQVSENALSFAKAMQQIQDKILSLKQAINPFMEAADEFLGKGFHDREKIMADPSPAGKQKWLDQMMKTYGKKSMPELNDIEKMQVFNETYEKISDGIHGTVQDESDPNRFDKSKVKGTGGDIMRQMAKGAIFIPENAKVFDEYQKLYGPATAWEGMERVITQASKDIASLSKYGPKPQETYDSVYNKAVSVLKGDERLKFIARKDEFDRAFKMSMGKYATSADASSQWAQNLLNAEYMSKTGGSILKALPDIRIAASLARDLNGHTIFQNVFSIVKELPKLFTNSDFRNERLGDLGLFSNAVQRDMMRTLGDPQGTPGLMGRGAQLMGRLTLHNRWVDSIRSGIGTLASKLMGEVSDRSWVELPDQFQQGLARYMDGHEWEAIRQGTEQIDGKTAITKTGIQALPDEVVAKYLNDSGQVKGNPSQRQLDYGKFQLGLKYGTMINEHADLSAAMSGQRQRQFMYRDTTINDGWGKIMRLALQFKAPAMVSSDVMRRGYFSNTTPGGDLAGVAQYITAGVFFSAMGIYAKQASEGKTLEDPTNAGFIARVLADSGFAHISGDVLLDAAQQGGTVKDKVLNIGNALMGPVANDVGHLGIGAAQKLYSMASGDEKSGMDASRDLSKTLVGVTPFQNLFYTKALLQYHIFNQFREFMGPGYLDHLEAGTRKSGQDYNFFAPTQKRGLLDMDNPLGMK